MKSKEFKLICIEIQLKIRFNKIVIYLNKDLKEYFKGKNNVDTYV